MSQNIASLSPGAACEPAKFIVQVVGKNHPESQRLVILDRSDEKQPNWLIGQDKTEIQTSETFSSVLHLWDFEGQGKRELWLEIATTDGSVMRVPLLKNCRSTPRQPEHQTQWNQIVSVVPMTALPGTKSIYDLGTPVLLRSGYIYVFYNNALWRELEVRVGPDKTTYHDIPLDRYRVESGYISGPREAIGLGLDDIWLPSQWNSTQPTNIQLCFSEVQLSAARIKRLEKDKSLLRQRCQSPDLRVSKNLFKQRFDGQPNGAEILEAFSSFNVRDYANQSAATKAQVVRRNMESNAFPVTLAAPQRVREPGYERFLDHPGRYICDLTGPFPLKSKETAQRYLDSCEKGEPLEDTGLLELEAWNDCLATLVSAKQPTSAQAAEGQNPQFWATQAAATDVLGTARSRQLCAVIIDDHMHRMRHLRTRITGLQGSLALCAQRASQHSNHASALLLQQLVVPRTLGGKPNPLNEALKKINEQGKRAINLNTATPERTLLWHELSYIKNSLAEHMERADYQQVVADHLSLDSYEYLAAYTNIIDLLSALATTPAQHDPLAVNNDLTDAVKGLSFFSSNVSKGQEFLSKLANNAEHPMHVMLWPDVAPDALSTAYKAPAQKDKNEGDGRFRATELAQFETQGLPTADQQTTLDAVVLAALMSSGSLNSSLTAQLRAGSSALVACYETLQGAVNTAEDALQKAREAETVARQELSAKKSAYKSAEAEYEAQRGRLAAHARVTNIRLHSKGLEMLRSIAPGTFGEVTMVRRGNVNLRDYYVFGLEDLPVAPGSKAVRFNGELLDAEGNPFADTNKLQAAKAGMTETSEHMLVVLPKNNATARMISSLNQQFNQVNQAAEQVQAIKGRVGAVEGELQEAVNELNSRSSSKAYRVLNSKTFPVAVLILEIWNVRAEISSFRGTHSEKGLIRALGGALGAGVDLLIALEALIVKFSSNQSAFVTRKVLLSISENAANKMLGEYFAGQLVKTFTSRLVAQIGAGLIFAGLSLYDAWYAFQWGDQAMWGYLLMAGGATAGVIASLFTAAPVLGLSPMGWVALMMLVAGAGVVYWLSSSPLEDWIASGPFSGSTSEKSRHLRDPQEAFYRLLGLFAGIRITTTTNPDYDPNAKLNPSDDVPFRVRAANTLVRIESNLPGLVGHLGSVNIEAECRQRRTVQQFAPNASLQHSAIGAVVKPVAQRLWPNALELYFNVPGVQQSTSRGSLQRITQGIAVKAQVRLTDADCKLWCFPAPTPKSNVSQSEATKGPDFNDDEQPFWASDTRHG